VRNTAIIDHGAAASAVTLMWHRSLGRKVTGVEAGSGQKMREGQVTISPAPECHSSSARRWAEEAAVKGTNTIT